MGRQTLGPMKAQCPCVGECQDWEAGIGGWVSEWGSTLIEAGMGAYGMKTGKGGNI